MQSTLLGLAIAIILALVMALVAPLVIDWNRYRPAFEHEASRLTGLAVHVDGSIDARILPMPRVTLRNVEIAAPGGPPRMRAAVIALEVGLGPLLRGKVRATQLRLIRPEIAFGLDRSGAIDWPRLRRRPARPDDFTVSRFSIEDGRVMLTDAGSGSRLVLQKLWFSGDIGSMLGPFRGNGAFVAGDELYGYRISGDRVDANGRLKLRLGVDPTDYPLTTNFDGALSFRRGVPQFAGSLTLSRPAGAALAHGKSVVSNPWTLTGAFRATPAAALLHDLAMQYGQDQRQVDLTGKAEVIFGAHPHLEGTVSAGQVNVDRALADPDLTRRPPLPLAKSFAQAFVTAAKLPVPANIEIAIDALTVGGAILESLKGGIRFDGKRWSLDGLKFRAPGWTDVTLSGRLDNTTHGPAFSGPADIQSSDLKMLVAWLEGRSSSPSVGARSFTAHGEIAVSGERFALDDLTAQFDQEKVKGRLAYAFAVKDQPATLDGQLRAAELDVDALTAFIKAAISGSAFAMPRQVALALDIGKATFAGITARTIAAQVKLNAGILHVDRLSIGDLGGAALDASGHIEELSSKPRGRLTLDLNAARLAGLSAVIGKFAPRAAALFGRFAARAAPAEVHGTLTVDRRATAGSIARLNFAGQLGALRLGLNGEVKGEPNHLDAAVVRIESRLDGDDGGALLRLFRLDPVLAVDQLPGELAISATGPLGGDLHVSALATAGGFSAAAQGTLRLLGGGEPSGSLQLQASAADLRPLHRTMTGQPGTAVPILAHAKMAIAGSHLSLTDLAVTIDKTALQGRVALDLASQVGIDGDIAADDVDAAAATALLLGLPGPAPGAPGAPGATGATGAGGLWSATPVGTGAFAAARGAVTFDFQHAVLTSGLSIRGLTGVVHFSPFGIAVNDIGGKLAGGRLTGALAFRHDGEAFTAKGHIVLADANAAAILGSTLKLADGRLTLKLQGESTGPSPKAFIGALHGSGAIALTDCHFAGLDTAAFAAALSAADRNGAVDASEIRAAVRGAMADGRLAVRQGRADVAIADGQIDLTPTTLHAASGAALSLGGVVDLNDATIDGRMILSAAPGASTLIRARPELAVIIGGPLAAPTRKLDVSALLTWLTLRSAERQTRRLESIEVNRRADVLEPAMHRASPPVRSIDPGMLAEMTLRPFAGHRLDRVRPEVPGAAPDNARTDAASPGRGAAAAASPPTAKPALPHVPRRRWNTTAAAARRPPPRRPSPPPAGTPALHSPLDLLFRSQN